MVISSLGLGLLRLHGCVGNSKANQFDGFLDNLADVSVGPTNLLGAFRVIQVCLNTRSDRGSERFPLGPRPSASVQFPLNSLEVSPALLLP